APGRNNTTPAARLLLAGAAVGRRVHFVTWRLSEASAKPGRSFCSRPSEVPMIKHASFVLTMIALALGGLGCSTDHGGMGDPDAGIQLPDSARPPDAVFYDAGVTPGSIGTACAADTDCGTM